MEQESFSPSTVEEVFKDFEGRRIGLIKALTCDVEDFFMQCDPGKENLCLYSFPDKSWEVHLPCEEVPPNLPEPSLGINFARDSMNRNDWVAQVAAHSDSWILALSSFYGRGFHMKDRKKLFKMIMELPTVYDVVTGRPSENGS